MKSIILYESKSGCTKKCAEYIQGNNDTEISVLTKFKGDISSYESIVIMGPVYMGKINKEVVMYLENNLSVLKTKKLYIVLCGMNIEGFDAMVKHNLSEEILRNSEVIYGGGAYYLEKLGFLQKRIVKSVAKITQSSEHIKYENLDKIKI